MNKKILSKLGDYLLVHRDQIVGEWHRAVKQNPDISSVGHLKDEEELVDHLPELCQNLAELLKSPQSDQNRAQIFRAARGHGRYRWRQGYRLEEVIREASVLRKIISHSSLDAYARKVPKLDGKTRRAAENIIHQAVDDVISDSANAVCRRTAKSHQPLKLAVGRRPCRGASPEKGGRPRPKQRRRGNGPVAKGRYSDPFAVTEVSSSRFVSPRSLTDKTRVSLDERAHVP